jgi:hypothetical protein
VGQDKSQLILRCQQQDLPCLAKSATPAGMKCFGEEHRPKANSPAKMDKGAVAITAGAD